MTMDDVDRAELEINSFLEASIAAARGIPGRRPPPPGARDCGHCGEPIPARRIAALPDTRLCCDCAAAAELRGRHRGRLLGQFERTRYGVDLPGHEEESSERDHMERRPAETRWR
jgi:hypothetical protein